MKALLFYFGGGATWLMGFEFPDRGLNLALGSESSVQTTGPPGIPDPSSK